MSAAGQDEIGAITWADLTIEGADEVRDFYRAVVGWEVSELDMGGYADYCMNAPGSGETKAGICHARGVNSDLPTSWLVYITVADLDESIRRCTELGGTVRVSPKGSCDEGRYCVIEDPSGAVAALKEAPRQGSR